MEMHEYLIEQWNKRVKPTEKVYVLGDFSFGNVTMTKRILDRLLGHKILIKGNHDMTAHKMLAAGFDEVHENITERIGDKTILLSHFPYHPMEAYAKVPGDTSMGESITMNLPTEKTDKRYLHKRIVDDGKLWLLHGHVHNAYKQNGRMINCGVDVWDYKPVGHEKILQMIEDGPKFLAKGE
jgi:calcineurin-like phosphoesterase family protein